MAASPLTTHFSTNCTRISSLQLDTSFMLKTVHPKTTPSKGISLVRASAANDKPPFVSQEDLKYLVVLGGGSVAGAAVIKYGSVIFPEITSPNLGQALFMIFAPTIIAVILLTKQSRIG